MGSRGDCYDNAVAESFSATLKKELMNGRSWPSKAELGTEVFEYIEVFFNRRRRHSTPNGSRRRLNHPVSTEAGELQSATSRARGCRWRWPSG
jgi:transposase InsO family protein